GVARRRADVHRHARRISSELDRLVDGGGAARAGHGAGAEAVRRGAPLALLCALACGRLPAPHAPAGPPEAELWLPRDAMEKGARVATVAEHELPQAVIAAGRIAFDDLRVAHVFPPVSGRITRLLAVPGQRV